MISVICYLKYACIKVLAFYHYLSNIWCNLCSHARSELDLFLWSEHGWWGLGEGGPVEWCRSIRWRLESLRVQSVAYPSNTHGRSLNLSDLVFCPTSLNKGDGPHFSLGAMLTFWVLWGQTLTPYFANNRQLMNLKTLVFMFIFAQKFLSVGQCELRGVWGSGEGTCFSCWWPYLQHPSAEPGTCLINICWMNERMHACVLVFLPFRGEYYEETVWGSPLISLVLLSFS